VERHGYSNTEKHIEEENFTGTLQLIVWYQLWNDSESQTAISQSGIVTEGKNLPIEWLC
jgi:hypothetical protein